jgi:predicted AAA+ superfamily ATPase
MYRNALGYLAAWFADPHRKPLVLRGARQVGKSTLVRLFAQEQGLTLHEINLERQLYLNDVFKTRNMAVILGEIQGLTTEIRRHDRSLIFLDEIQAVPEALQSLRYFYEDRPELAVVAAGSLLEFTLADHDFSMPVGRISYYHMGPLSFEEFLRAADEDLYRFYADYRWLSAIPQSYHERLLHRQREYLFVGGMPEALKLYLEAGSYNAAQEVHRSILDTYIDDFAKYARKAELARLQKVFRSIPLLMGKKVVFANFSRDDRSADVRSAIDLLCKARIGTKVYHTDCSGLPLGAGRDDAVFKLVFIDVGLMNSQLGLDWPRLLGMDERALINEGSRAEQFVAQELLASDQGRRSPELYFWLREGKSNNAEVDYVVSHAGNIVPVEVKAGKSGTLKSLRQFVQQKRPPIALRFDLNPPSEQRDFVDRLSCPLVSLPLYLAGKLPEILDAAL